jgi:hypothetical protein
MKKSIVSVGCSFTYGEGLQYFSELPSVVFTESHSYNPANINLSQFKFVEKYRYSQQIADRLNTTLITRSRNGGSHNQIESFLEIILPIGESANLQLHDMMEHFQLDDELHLRATTARLDEVSHIIIQTTNPMRDIFEFESNGVIYNTTQFNNDKGNCPIYESFINYAIEKFGGYPELEEYVFSQFLNRIEDRCKLYESYGIKIMLLLWQDENNNTALNHPYFKDKITKIYYNNNEYTSIRQWQLENPKFFIKNSFRHIGMCKGDEHPTLEGHTILAESILKQM